MGYLLSGNKTEASLCNFQSEEACPLMQEEAEHQVVRPPLLPNMRNMLKLHPVGMKKEKHDKHLNTSGDSSSTLSGKVTGDTCPSIYGLFDGSSVGVVLTVLFLFFRMTLRVMHEVQLGQNSS